MDQEKKHEAVMECRGITKTFGPVVALDRVDLTVRRGEVRGLIGENGSGKSTVTSIFSGMQPADSGEMLYKGRPWKPSSMQWAAAQGVGMIVQETGTVPEITVAENMFLCEANRFALWGGNGKKWGLISGRAMVKAAQKALDDIGASHIRADAVTNTLDMQDRKLVEVAKVWMQDPEIIVVDETTTALSHTGRQILYRIVHDMAERGRGVVFISHDMDEILEQCSCLTVLRDGEIIGTLSREEMDAPDAVQRIRYMMVGREIGEKYYREDYDPSHSAEAALELRGLCFGPIRDFSLTLHEGEIVGIGGLSGCGMHEIGRAAYGLEKLSSGSVVRRGVEIRNCLTAIQNGIGYISKNRDTEALILEASIQENITLPSLPALSHATLIRPGDERRLSDGEIDAFRIKCGSGRQWVNTLSGGNKQKVSFAKWTAKGSQVIVMDCPTRGVDIGVKQAMYAVIEEMKRQGKAILMISEELSELIGMADRLLIMKDFQVAREFVRSPELKQTDIIEYMI